MIKDRIENGHRYDGLHKNMRMVMEILQSLNMEMLQLGHIELDGKYIYINVDSVNGRSREEARIEAHRKYIDIQIPISGKEVIGVMPITELKEVSQSYNEEKDVMFYSDKISNWEEIEPGEFIIFFPEDGHAPLVECGKEHKKLVVKMSVEPNNEKPTL